MPLIEWKNFLSVGIEEIDQQHKKLVDIINELNQAMMIGKGKDLVENTLEALFLYIKVHFKTEEDYFARYNYPDAKAHIQQHEEFAKKIYEFHDQLHIDKIDITSSLSEYIGYWMKNHLMEMDMKYADFFRQRGIDL